MANIHDIDTCIDILREEGHDVKLIKCRQDITNNDGIITYPKRCEFKPFDEVLIKSNSTDSISDFAVELSLGDKENTGAGYAIISKVSLTALSSADEFEHYSELVGDDNDNIKKAFYDEKATSSTTEDESKTDDKNSLSWATFFYIFSSLLLVVTMAVAMIAILFKKHPIKFAHKYANEHERDIDITKSKKTKTKPSTKNDVVIGEDNADKQQKKNSGGIE